MARLSSKPALFTHSRSNAMFDSAASSQQLSVVAPPSLREQQLMFQNRQLAMKSEGLMQQVSKLENEMVSMRRQLLVSRKKEAVLNNKLVTAMASIRDNLQRNFSDMMGHYNEEMGSLGVRPGSSFSGALVRTQDVQPGYFEGLNSQLTRRVTSSPAPDSIAEVSENSPKAIAAAPAPRAAVVHSFIKKDLRPPVYKEIEEHVPEKRRVAVLPPLRQNLLGKGIPSLGCGEKDTVETLAVSPINRVQQRRLVALRSSQSQKATSPSPVKRTPPGSPVKDSLDSVETPKSGNAQSTLDTSPLESSPVSTSPDFNRELDFDTAPEPLEDPIEPLDTDEASGVSNVPLTENPFRDSSSSTESSAEPEDRKKKKKKSRKRLSGLPRELRNLKFEMPLSWKGVVGREDGDNAQEKPAENADNLADRIPSSPVSSADDSADRSVDEPIPIVLGSHLRRINAKSGSKRRKVAQFGKQKKAKSSILGDVTNRKPKRKNGKKKNAIFDLSDDSDNNKENLAPRRRRRNRI